MDIIGQLTRRCDGRARIAYPEATEERVLRAARLVLDQRIGRPVLIGDPAAIKTAAKKAGIALDGMDIVDAGSIPSDYIAEYIKLRGKKMAPALAEHILKDPLYRAVMAVRRGDADTMVAGAVYASADVICAARAVIGMAKGVSTPSSFFVMDVPGSDPLLFSDCSANIKPDASELADIAITSARTAAGLLGWKPRVAMLSFSTKGSAAGPEVDLVVEATRLAKKREPKIAIDGEFQGDTALVESTARKKIPGDIGPVAGRANVLIFPDIDAGNICYKLVSILAKAKAYGPVMQGFAKPVSDLSRGATPEAIAGISAIVAAWGRKA